MTRRTAAAKLLKLILLAVVLTATVTQAADYRYLVYVGTYTDKDSKGIYAYRFDPDTGASDPVGLVAETANPSFLAVDPSRKYLYAVNEIDNFQGGHTGAVSVFAVDRDSGKLTLLQQVSSLGAGPAHVALDKTGRFLLVGELRWWKYCGIPYRTRWPTRPANSLYTAWRLQRKQRTAGGPPRS